MANDADRAKGLMFRQELPEGQGMLFDFQRDQDVAMWMRNTYIPLDMIFITGRRRASGASPKTPSRSRIATIPSGGPCAASLR